MFTKPLLKGNLGKQLMGKALERVILYKKSGTATVLSFIFFAPL